MLEALHGKRDGTPGGDRVQAGLVTDLVALVDRGQIVVQPTTLTSVFSTGVSSYLLVSITGVHIALSEQKKLTNLM